MSAIVVLGMHRSGTSSLAAMLVAAGGVLHGDSLRNWDNPGGHFEAAALVRLNEDVLAASGGHWLRPPPKVAWSAAQAAERDRLLGVRGAVWKDPRALLVWPFWAGADARFVGVVRHPLAVARSLWAWRGTPIDDGLRLWRAHNVALLASGAPVLCFDRPTFVADVSSLASSWGLDGGVAARAYVAERVHHGAGAGPTGDASLLAECTALYAALGGVGAEASAAGPGFDWAAVHACIALANAGDIPGAIAAAVAAGGDPVGVVAPVADALLNPAGARALLAVLDAVALPPAVGLLLRGKALLAAGEPAAAVVALTAALDAEAPLHEALHLLPVALWESGDREAADAALAALAPVALYPFRVHARRAEWAWLRGDAEAALGHLDAALAAAPTWRHGRLLHRRAAWRERLGDAAGAIADRALAAERDPGYRRKG
jgi:hypothetical protein